MRAASAGTKLPTCAMSTMRATCRMYVDLPAMLGPVSTISDVPACPSAVSLGTKGARAHDVLHHRVPSRRDLQHTVLRELRADVAVAGRRLRETAEEVHLRHRRRRLQDARRLVGDLTAHLPEDGALQLLQPLLSVQDQRLELLQFRRDVPLGVHQRLPPDVLLRHPRQVRVGHLQVVAEDPVVADLQRPRCPTARAPAAQARRCTPWRPATPFAGCPDPPRTPAARRPRGRSSPTRRRSRPAR